jgi:hypothetical protein
MTTPALVEEILEVCYADAELVAVEELPLM